MAYKLQTNIQEIDVTTGEIIRSTLETTEIKKLNQRPFFITYTDVITDLMLITATEQAVLYYLLKESDYGNQIKISKKDKENIAGIINRSVRSVESAINTLTRFKVLLSLSRGHYQINPLYFWKGRSKDNDLTTEQISELKLLLV